MKRPGRQRRVRDGVVEFRCTMPGCRQWKSKDNFLTRSNAPPWYVHGRCNECRLAQRRQYDGSPLVAAKRSMAEKTKRAAYTAVAREGDRQRKKAKSSESAPVFVEREKILPFLSELLKLAGNDMGRAAHLSGTTNRTLYAIRTGERDSARWAVAESIAIAVDMLDAFMAQFPEPGMDGWAPNRGHRYCRRCGRWDLKHAAKGYCFRCYPVVQRATQMGRPIPPLRSELWSIWSVSCIRCGTNKKHHQAFGLCFSCYDRVRRKACFDWKRWDRLVRERRLARARAGNRNVRIDDPVPESQVVVPFPTERASGRVSLDAGSVAAGTRESVSQ